MEVSTIEVDNVGKVEVGFIGYRLGILVNVSGQQLSFDHRQNEHLLEPVSIVPAVEKTVQLEIDRHGQERLSLVLNSNPDCWQALESLYIDVGAKMNLEGGNPVLLVGTLEMAKAYPNLVVAPILAENWEYKHEPSEKRTYCSDRFLTYGRAYAPGPNGWPWDHTLVKVQATSRYVSASI